MRTGIGGADVILILISAAYLGVWHFDDQGGSGGSESISMTPDNVPAGGFSTFEVRTGSGKGTVKLPHDVFPVIGGVLVEEDEIDFRDSPFRFTVLVPHSSPGFEIIVESSGSHASFGISTTSATDPLLSGESFFQSERYLVDNFPGRVTDTQAFRQALDHYDTIITQLGFKTEVQHFTRSENLRQYDVENLIAYSWGRTRPDRWIVVGGHLDIVDQTYQGAYDDGSGAVAIVELAKAVSALHTDKTVVLALWGGEEQGAWGSEYFVDNLPDNVTVEIHLNYDMVGINWPGRSEYHGYVGPDNNDQVTEHPAVLALMERAVFGVLDYPDEAFISQELEVGNGDHDSFMNAGIPSVFFFGMTFESWTTNYHTPTDTVEGMELHAGGHDELVGGFNTVAWIGYYVIILIDNDDEVQY